MPNLQTLKLASMDSIPENAMAVTFRSGAFKDAIFSRLPDDSARVGSWWLSVLAIVLRKEKMRKPISLLDNSY